MCCSVLQHTATHFHCPTKSPMCTRTGLLYSGRCCYVCKDIFTCISIFIRMIYMCVVPRTLLQHTAATHRCNTLLQHTAATHCFNIPLEHPPGKCCCVAQRRLLQYTTATHYCDTLLQHTTATQHCKTPLQNTTAKHHCNTLLQNTIAKHNIVLRTNNIQRTKNHTEHAQNIDDGPEGNFAYVSVPWGGGRGAKMRTKVAGS